MIKNLIGFIVLILGMGGGYLISAKMKSEPENITYVEVLPISFTLPQNSMLGRRGGGSCGG